LPSARDDVVPAQLDERLVRDGAGMSEYAPVRLAWERLPPEESLARSRAFLQRMRSRRSVRRFSPEPVPWELIENAVATAGTAPSGAHQQPWTFAVVSDADLKRRIREAAEEAERDFYERLAPPDWLDALRPLGTDFVKEHLTEAPFLIVVFEQAYRLDPDGSRRKHYYAKESVGIAVGLLLASLHQAGLAALTHTPAPMSFLRTLLERPPNERPYILIPVGYPADDAEVPDLTRKPLDEILIVR
jgi:iodotyrosine deiodinase